jgi:hypothetical protein
MTAGAHSEATLGITIVVKGLQAWPKATFGDNAFYDETVEDFTARVNSICLDQEFDLASQARTRLINEHNSNKEN